MKKKPSLSLLTLKSSRINDIMSKLTISIGILSPLTHHRPPFTPPHRRTNNNKQAPLILLALLLLASVLLSLAFSFNTLLDKDPWGNTAAFTRNPCKNKQPSTSTAFLQAWGSSNTTDRLSLLNFPYILPPQQEQEQKQQNEEAYMLFKLGLLLSWDFNRLPPNQALLAFQHCSQAGGDGGGGGGGGGNNNNKNTAATAMCYWGQAYSLGPYLNAVPGTGEEPWPIFSPQMMQQAHEAATTAYQLAQQTLHDAVAEEQQEEDSSIYKKKKKTTLRQQLQQQVAYTKAAVDRYDPTTHSPPPSRHAAETEYARTMEAIGEEYADPTAYALAAEAWLNVVPWDFDVDDDKGVGGGGSGGRSFYFNNSNSNKLRKEVVKAVELINKALNIYPDHPLALHLGVHIAEIGDAETKEKEDSGEIATLTNTLTKSSNTPSWGEMCADRLYNLHPRMGHLQHMPSHVYIRVGRWHDAVKVNIHGAYVADVENTLGHGGSGYGGSHIIINNNNNNMYTKSGDGSSNCLNAYLPEHNLQMLVFAASMSGEYEALKHWAGDKMYHLREEVGEEAAWPGRERTYLMLEHVRRGMWEEVMMTRGAKRYERGPGAVPGGFEYAQGVWHFGRCMAAAGQAAANDDGSDGSSSVVKSFLRQAKKEKQKLDEIAASMPPDIHTMPGRGVGIYSPGYNDLMKIMQLVADARLATLKKEENYEEEEGGRKMTKMTKMNKMMTSREERWAAAAMLLEEAVKVEEAQGYTEPPRLVGAPTRHCWGYSLLQSGSNSIAVVEKAVEVYEEGLRRYPGDGWALLGLGQALKKVRGREKESIAALDAADEAFKYADIKPKTSCPSFSL